MNGGLNIFIRRKNHREYLEGIDEYFLGLDILKDPEISEYKKAKIKERINFIAESNRTIDYYLSDFRKTMTNELRAKNERIIIKSKV